MFAVKAIHILLFFSPILQKSALVSCLQCRYCSSVEYNSNCRLGTEETTKTCDPNEGDDSCYEEYLIGEKRTDVPLYRRGCAPKDWCKTQKTNHGTDLKDCKTCQSDKCNKDVFGSTDGKLICRSCQSEDPDSSCRKGGMDLKAVVCRSGENMCTTSLISTSLSTIWERGCGKDGYCKDLSNKYGHSLEKCIVCHDALCNNLKLPIPV